MADLLTQNQIDTWLESHRNWNYASNKLKREYRFSNFIGAFTFMTGAAFIAEKLNHHPDWTNSYDRVVVELSTHSAGGVTELDFRLAEAMENLAGGGPNSS